MQVGPSAVKAPIPPRGAKHFRSIDALRENDGADGVVEIEMRAADELREVGRERLRRQWSGGDDDRMARGGIRDSVDFFADDRDERMRGQLAGDDLGEPLAIDGESGARGNPAGFRGAHHERAEPPHFFFEEADGVIELVAAEGIAADQFGEAIGFVHGGRAHRPHLVERDRHALRRGLPRGLGAGQAAADDVDVEGHWSAH